MSCTRRKESPAAIFLGGAGGREVRIGRQRSRVLLPGGDLRFGLPAEGALVVQADLASFAPDGIEAHDITMVVLSEDASPAEVYS